MNTFNKLWGVVTPKEAKEKIDEQRAVLNGKTPEKKSVLVLTVMLAWSSIFSTICV